MGSTRKCLACAGTGSLWGTPKLTPDSADFGLNVVCWRCLGKGTVPEDRRDEGETNDAA